MNNIEELKDNLKEKNFNKQDKILLYNVIDKIKECYENDKVVITNFYNLSELSLIKENILKYVKNIEFYGGYDNFDRNVLIIFPNKLQDISQYINQNIDEYISVIKIINSTHNNLSPFEEIPCQIFAPPDKEEKSYLSGEDIEINFGEKYGTIKFNNISVTVSPASEPIDDDVCVIYGYKKNIPELLGRVYCSNRRIDDKYGFTNLYYQTAEYFVSENNIIQPIYQ